MTIFIFVLSLNWVGLLPGVTSIGYYEIHEGVKHFVPFLYPAATDLNITIAFALIAFFTIEISGVLAIGFFKYTGKFLNFSSVGAFALGLLELISELARLVSFSFRLFGNIFAGKTLLVVAIFFVPYIIPVPLLAFDARGFRLGYGGGFYDRTLAGLPGAVRIGYAFAAQEVNEVPIDAFDQRLDVIVTEQGVREFSR